MTREEAKQDLQLLIEFYNNDSGSAPLCLEYCLNMLEQEPCEDAIHRDRIVQDFADKCRECGREKVLDKIRAEIEKQEKWLMDAGYNAYNVDIALDAIKLVVAESEDKE